MVDTCEAIFTHDFVDGTQLRTGDTAGSVDKVDWLIVSTVLTVLIVSTVSTVSSVSTVSTVFVRISGPSLRSQ